MTNTTTYTLRNNIWYTLLDAGALTFIYFVPAISHTLNIPVYLFEPMRIMLFLALAFSSKNNSYILALSLPLFSFLISSHPSLIKSSLIAFELATNVFLFYTFTGMMKNKFAAAFSSIILSKIIYYLLKYVVLSFALLEGSLISTPLYIQLIVTAVLSICIFGVYRLKTPES